METRKKHNFLIGDKLGHFEYLSEKGINKSRKRLVELKCKCGAISTYTLMCVIRKPTACCSKCAISKLGVAHKTHGMTNTNLYVRWGQMKTRCYNKNRRCYTNYGMRGIKVCDEWMADFLNFYNWAINNGWDESLELDRIDVNGDYCPENCRFISKAENQRNKTNTYYIIINGNKTPLLKWLDSIGHRDKYFSMYHGMRSGGHTLEYYIGIYNLPA